MAYQKRTEKEIKALENLTFREVSRAYYEANKLKIAPVIHNKHILMFRRTTSDMGYISCDIPNETGQEDVQSGLTGKSENAAA